MLATNPVERLETVSAASVRGHIWGPRDSVNAFFAILLRDFEKKAAKARIPALFCAREGFWRRAASGRTAATAGQISMESPRRWRGFAIVALESIVH